MRGAFLLLVMLLALVQVGWADEITVVLQDGLNGYEGCQDAFVFNNASSTKFGKAESLNVVYGGC